MKEFYIIAATGCPTGIAHTYMAQEALEQAAKKANVRIKVETHGQIGIENELTDEDIASADAVIIAADKDVQADRFVNKPIIDVSVSQGIKQAEKLVQDAIDGKGEVKYKSQTGKVEQQQTTNKNNQAGKIGHKIYKDLMNGVSHMLPFVVGGGVLVAISFLWGIYSADPASAEYNEFAAMLKNIGGIWQPLLCCLWQ